MPQYTLTVNGITRTVEAEPKTPLLHILRRTFGLTGTKQGCDNGSCGACTVVVNGKAVKSCVYHVSKADGAEVVTIEGLARGTDLHPVQRALVDSGAIQCGFCTPGIVMELYALLESNPEPDETTLRKALNRHLCRCTGYEAIVLAGKLAVEYTKKAAV